MRHKNDRLYQRGGGRWYADLRDHGGGREAMIPVGEKQATLDRDVAVALLATRLKDLEQRRRTQQLQGLTRIVTVAEYCGEWLDARRATDTRPTTLARYDLAFHQLFKVLDPSTRMDEIGVNVVRRAIRDARSLKSRKGGTLSSASLRQMIAAMRQVCESAMIDGVVPEGSIRGRAYRRARGRNPQRRPRSFWRYRRPPDSSTRSRKSALDTSRYEPSS
jgi:hypothetical protein